MAHAFFPNGGSKDGVVHLDYDEDWDSPTLEKVLLHEFGHTFGLSHSSDNQSVMFPWYSSSIDRLNQDDKNGIESIYGLKNKWAYNPYNPYNPKNRTTSTPNPTLATTLRPVTTPAPKPKNTTPRPVTTIPVHPNKTSSWPHFINISNSTINNLIIVNLLKDEKTKLIFANTGNTGGIDTNRVHTN